ncbi:hypothetical protein ACJRO7_004172 [Eucalyptus globulus]|uniref:Transcription initiation factor TFIID subunit 9 n=1 Tax=Eucalyptus globulus TaxID=34317 RepID=A0ABD3IY80_EUCGL
MAENDEDLQIPRDAKIIKSLLQSMGIEEYEPYVVHQMLELWYKYAGDVLTDAELYSEHASRSWQKSELPRTVAGPGTLLPPELDTSIFPNYQLTIPEKQPLEELEQDEVAKLNPSLEQSMETVQHTPSEILVSPF